MQREYMFIHIFRIFFVQPSYFKQNTEPTGKIREKEH